MPISTDNYVFDSAGRLVVCSAARFVRDICYGDSCLICGRSETETPFNREHILPNWLLHRFNLHGQTVTLPNGKQHKYGSYTLPCCIECNQHLSDTFEAPISEAFKRGFIGVKSMVDRDGTERLFLWMAFIYLKLHLKDRLLKKHLDPRLGTQAISEGYEWDTLHHIHCLARAHYKGARLNDFVLGSFMLVQLVPNPEEEPFDFTSLIDASTLFLRAGDLALYVVFNDGQACMQAIEPILNRINGPLNVIQSRELAAELAAANLHLINRPVFRTTVADADGADPQMNATLDPTGPRFLDKDSETVGRIKCLLFNHVLDRVEGKTREEAVTLLKDNRLSFLFNDDGDFISDGWRGTSTLTS